MNFDYQSRRRKLQAAMGESDVDAMILSTGSDLPYFTGYEAMASERLTALVVTAEESVLLVPKLEAPRVAAEGLEVRPWGETEDPVELASSVIKGSSQIAVGDHMWAVFVTRFLEALPECRWLAASQVTSGLRIRKDDREIGFLRQAAQAVDRAMARIPAQILFSGRTETEVARELGEMTIEEGHDESSFTIVAAGRNGASPHHHPGARQMSDGDIVVCDFGGRLGGYFSDSTRTFVVGGATDEQAEVHEVVRRANEAGHEAAKPGVACSEVDAAAREVIEDAGYGDCFIHRTGHGIGLDVHEHPYIVEGNEAPLEPGMAFSIEPGIYIPERFGVRIEDIVVCTNDGIESLNRSDRALSSVS